MNQMQVFRNSEFGELGVLEIDGKPYFPATACAKKLGYTNPQKAIRDHCKGVNEMVTPTNGGTQTTRFIPEGDLYRLITQSKLAAAERFESWVFDTVLPEIRKRGTYIPNLEEIIAKTATAVVKEIMKQMLPVMTAQLQCIATPTVSQTYNLNLPPKAKHHKTHSIISHLNDSMRAEVERMILLDEYTLQDIVDYLGGRGIKISAQSVNRYAHKILD